MLKTPVLTALAALFATHALAAAPQADIETGRLAGKTDGASQAFLGIPYAAAPVGANRWRAPQPAAGWSGVRDATAYGASCMQAVRQPPAGGPAPTPSPVIGEDCLFLNVWTPSVRPSARLPVLVFFHGGGWNGGSGSDPTFAGASMAGHGVVMVTVNFRLGLFGFLAHQGLLDEAGDTGDYGLMDETAALQWVKRNIAVFGGDPNQVTIAGQSSGSASVRDLDSIPAGVGLFKQVIAESTPFRGAGTIALSEALVRGARFAQLAHASSLAELRAMPADQLQKLVPPGLPRDNPVGFLPVSGTRFFPEGVKERETAPMMAGSNTWENRMYGASEWAVDDEAGLQAMLKAHFKDAAPRFAGLYQPASYGGSVNAAAHAILADGPAIEVAQVQRARGPNAAPVYTYLWTHALPGDQGAVHASELAYVYGNLAPGRRAYTAEDYAISKEVNAYWVNFIKTGDPNGPGLPKWPQARSGQTMELGDHFAPSVLLTPAKLDAYRDFAAHGGQFGLP